MSALLADLKDFLADVPNERGVGDGMKAWAKELLHRLNAASTDVADHEGMVGDEGVGGGVDGHAEGIASRSPRLGNTEAVTLKGGVPPTGMASVKRTPNSQSIGLNPASAAGSEYRISPADSQVLDSRSECQPEVGPYENVDGALNTGEGVSGIAEGREVDTRAGSYTRDRVSPSSVGSETTQVSGCMTSENQASPADSQFQSISQKQRIDAEMRLIFRSSAFTTLDPADDPRPRMSRLHPRLLSLDNQMEAFWQEYKRKQGVPVETVTEEELIKAEVDLFEMLSNHSGESPAACRETFIEELSKFPRDNEAQLEQEFVDTASRLAAKYQKRSRFSWSGLVAILAVAAVVAWLTYSFVEGF